MVRCVDPHPKMGITYSLLLRLLICQSPSSDGTRRSRGPDGPDFDVPDARGVWHYVGMEAMSRRVLGAAPSPGAKRLSCLPLPLGEAPIMQRRKRCEAPC